MSEGVGVETGKIVEVDEGIADLRDERPFVPWRVSVAPALAGRQDGLAASQENHLLTRG